MSQITFHVEVALQAIPSTLALLPDGTCNIQVSINANLNPHSLESFPGVNQQARFVVEEWRTSVEAGSQAFHRTSKRCVMSTPMNLRITCAKHWTCHNMLRLDFA